LPIKNTGRRLTHQPQDYQFKLTQTNDIVKQTADYRYYNNLSL